MTLVVDRNTPQGEPAVHVLVVAVGDYPYLEDGAAGSKFDKMEGVGQLSSPPVSARHIVDWLTTQYSPYKSHLSTVDVLCSGSQTFVDETGNSVVAERGTLINLRIAVNAWRTRGDSDEHNTLIFFFCGHGVSSGDVTSLLMEEFGSDELDPFSTGAVDANTFMSGMIACKARNQLYLLDACRYIPIDYMAEFGDSRGVPLVKHKAHANLGRTRQVSLWATQFGKSAYGRAKLPTVFTEAFLASMRGASARPDEETGQWVIQGAVLAEGVNVFVKRSDAVGKQSATNGFMTEGFPIHVLGGLPLVPVNVICKPAKKSKLFELGCNPGAFNVSGLEGPWHLELRRGVYTVTAKEAGTDEVLTEVECIASPPFELVSMMVGE